MFMKLTADPPDLAKVIHCISKKQKRNILKDLLQFTDRIYGTVCQNF
jgi:hypothetical protein